MDRKARPYQLACVQAVEDALDRGVNRCLYVLPTGCGKTYAAGLVHEAMMQRGLNTALVLAHRYELIDQWVYSLREHFPELVIEPETAEHRAWPDADIVVGMVQTVANPGRLKGRKFDAIYLDEVHHAIKDSQYDKVVQRFNPEVVIGMTATPKRLDRKALHSKKGALIQEVVFTYTLKQAHADGWVCSMPYYVVKGVDIGSVRVTAGELNEQELAFKIDSLKRTEAALAKWEQVAVDRKTIGFCVNVAHAMHSCEAWNLAGYTAEYVHGAMSKEERAGIMGRFRSGVTQCLFNCMIATEGFDVPDIGCVVLLRPTLSWSLYCQQFGRGTRICVGKENCIVIDVADIAGAMSPITLPQILDLPYKIDLQGQDVFEAAARAEKVAASVKAKPPRNYQELQLMSEQLDILSALQTPEEILNYTNLKWLKTEAGYVLYVNKGRLELTDDALGDWHFKGMEANEFKAGGDLKEAFARADEYVRSAYPGQMSLLDRRASWQKRKPSDAQLRMLRRVKISEDVISIIDSGTAAAVITQKIGKGTEE